MKRLAIGAAALLIVAAAVVGAIGIARPSAGLAGSGPVVVDPLAPLPISPVRADLRSVVVLDGVVRPVDPRTVKSRRSGVVDRLVVHAGATVKKNATLLTLRTDRGKYRVRAPAAGVVVAIDVLKGQQVQIGDPVGIIAAPTFVAEATVEPALLYRLYSPPLEIQAQLDRGPASFACKFVSIGANLDGAANPLDQPVLIRCAIPAEVRVFAGVRARLAITTATATDAIVVPLEAVEGSADRGVLTIVDADGSQHRRDVTLGISDGIRVQVLAGLADGERFLEFPPATQAGVPASSARP